MEKSNVLLYVSFKKYPELGRLKVVSTTRRNFEDCSVSCIMELAGESFCADCECGNKNYHFECA